MKTTSWVIIGLGALIIILLAAIVAGQVGGIAIRKQGATASSMAITVSEPIVRGVPVVMHWDPAAGTASGPLLFDWRDEFAEYHLGEAQFADGHVAVSFPCEAAGKTGGLVIRAAETGKVIGNQLLRLAPAGPECVK